MDARIREYANALYIKEMGVINEARSRELRELAANMGARGLTHSGMYQAERIKANATVIGGHMMARLTSFQQALGEASVRPSSEDLQEIWHMVTEVHKTGVVQLETLIRADAIASGFIPPVTDTNTPKENELLTKQCTRRKRQGMRSVAVSVLPHTIQRTYKLC